MRIGIAVDGSPWSTVGLELIASLPLSPSSRVDVVAVAQPPELLGTSSLGHAPPQAVLTQGLAGTARDRARLVADRAVERLIGQRCQVTPIVVVGHPIDVLTSLATDADLDLLVVGPRGQSAGEPPLLGSVSQGLLHTLPTSVLVARPSAGPTKRLLLAVDGSSDSIAASEFVLRMPLPWDTHVRVVTCVTAQDELEQVADASLQELRHTEEENARSITSRTASIIERHGRGCSTEILHGPATRRILDEALEFGADCVVVGARGLGASKELALGSVARGVSKRAPCSVLVYSQPSSRRRLPTEQR